MSLGDGLSRAVVMGGSLGGLNAALWLGEAGWDVVVLERSHSPLEGRGAGIVLHPATVRYLAEHLLADLDEISAPASWLRYLDRGASVAHQASPATPSGPESSWARRGPPPGRWGGDERRAAALLP